MQIRRVTSILFCLYVPEKSCGSAGVLLNGDVQYPTGNEFGDKAVIVCNTGLVWKSLFMMWVDLYFAVNC